MLDMSKEWCLCLNSEALCGRNIGFRAEGMGLFDATWRIVAFQSITAVYGGLRRITADLRRIAIRLQYRYNKITADCNHLQSKAINYGFTAAKAGPKTISKKIQK
jgi:hypothetical protein